MTLRAAHAQALKANDRTGSLLVATTAHRLAKAELDRADTAGEDVATARHLSQLVVAIRDRFARGSLDHGRALLRYGFILFLKNELAPAKERLERALTIFTTRDPGSPDHARTLRNLSAVAFYEKDLKRAKTLQEEALAIRRTRAPDSADVADSLAILAIIVRTGGDREQSRRYRREAAAILAAVQPQDRRVADSLHGLAAQAQQLGDAEEAKQLAQQSVTLWERLAPKSAQMVSILNLQAVILGESGDRRAEWSLRQRALALQETLKPGSTEVATLLGELANLAAFLQDATSGRAYAARAVALLERHSPGALELARLLHLEAIFAQRQDELAAARRLHEKALKIREQRAGGTALLADSLREVGWVARQQGDQLAARDFYRRALEIDEKVAPNSFGMADSLVYLSRISADLGEFAAEREYSARAAPLLQFLTASDKSAPQQQILALSFTLIGFSAWVAGDAGRAREQFQRALAIHEAFEPGSDDAARLLRWLGDLAYRQGEVALAEREYRQAADRYRAAAPGTVEAAEACLYLAAVLDLQGRVPEAIERLGEGLPTLEKQRPRSPQLAAALRCLAGLHHSRGDERQARECLARAAAVEERIRTLPSSHSENDPAPPVRPRVEFVSPADNSVITGERLELQVAVFSPIPVDRLRVWINGGRRGGEAGLDVRDPAQAGGRGLILAKGEDRQELARALPEPLSELARKPQYARALLLPLQYDVPDNSGPFVHVAVTAVTGGGSTSDTQILRLRNPKAEQERGRLRVLAVGINDYAHPSIPGLRFAAADARDLGSAFQSLAGEGRLHREARVEVLTDREATRAGLSAALMRLSEDARPEDTLILALSGHGLKDGDRYYFATVDADPARLEETALRWEAILAPLKQAQDRQVKAVWLLADCCRAAPELARDRQATAAELRRGLDERGNLFLVTASSGNRPSYESVALGHGLFSQAWLEALRGQAPERYRESPAFGRVLTLTGLLDHLGQSVREHAARTPGVPGQQVYLPQVVASFAGETFLFSVPDQAAR